MGAAAQEAGGRVYAYVYVCTDGNLHATRRVRDCPFVVPVTFREWVDCIEEINDDEWEVTLTKCKTTDLGNM